MRTVDSLPDVGLSLAQREMAGARSAASSLVRPLPASQTGYREFSEANPDAVVIVDEKGRINFANRRVEGMLGYAPSELLGKSPNVLVPDRY